IANSQKNRSANSKRRSLGNKRLKPHRLKGSPRLARIQQRDRSRAEARNVSGRTAGWDGRYLVEDWPQVQLELLLGFRDCLTPMTPTSRRRCLFKKPQARSQ